MNDDYKRTIFDAAVWSVALVFAGVLLAADARADGKYFGPPNTTYKAECGSCHVAYPPELLPASAWRTMLNGLDKHFGTDATIDDKALAEIRVFVESNAAGARRRAAEPSLRITETTWFQREHREVPARVWKGAAVKSAANCGACHTGADQGDFRERGIRVPREGVQ